MIIREIDLYSNFVNLMLPAKSCKVCSFKKVEIYLCACCWYSVSGSIIEI